MVTPEELRELAAVADEFGVNNAKVQPYHLREAADEIERLRAALAPFARFWDAQQHMGGSYPKSGTVFHIHSHIGGERELTVENFKSAHDLIPS